MLPGHKWPAQGPCGEVEGTTRNRTHHNGVADVGDDCRKRCRVRLDIPRLLQHVLACPQRHSATAVSRPFLPQISPIFRHFSPVLSVSAPGSQKPQKNGEKTAQNGRKVAEKIGGQVALGYQSVLPLLPVGIARLHDLAVEPAVGLELRRGAHVDLLAVLHALVLGVVRVRGAESGERVRVILQASAAHRQGRTHTTAGNGRGLLSRTACHPEARGDSSTRCAGRIRLNAGMWPKWHS